MQDYTPREILLIKNGELALKGLNRRTFEEALMSNLRYRDRKSTRLNSHHQVSRMPSSA